MKAILHRKFGSTQNLKLEEVPLPEPKPKEVLIKTMATGVNSWDGDMVLGRPLILRLLFGLFTPRHKIIGCDVAGIVEKTGSATHRFKPGDRIFGDISDAGWGGFAEYVAAKESALTFIPDKVSFEEAAAIPQAGYLSLQSLRFNGKINSGDKVLFNGAGGGVGTLGLQLAKEWGAEVTVIDHASKLDRLLELGADIAYDYSKVDYTQGDAFDLIIDVVADKPFNQYEKVVKPNGCLAIVGGKISTLLQAGWAGRRMRKKTGKKMGIMGMQYKTEDLDYLINKVANGTLKPIISKVYPLEEVPEALQMIIDKKVFGKLVISLNKQSAQ